MINMKVTKKNRAKIEEIKSRIFVKEQLKLNLKDILNYALELALYNSEFERFLVKKFKEEKK